MTCNKIKEILFLYEDDLLGPEEKLAVEKHLKRCKLCRRELSDLREIQNLLSQIPVPEPAKDLNSRITAHLSFYERVSKFCPQIKGRLPLYLDNLLSLEEKNQVEEHLKLCNFCNRELNNLQEISSLLKEITVPEPSPDLSLQIENRLLREQIVKKEIGWRRFAYPLPRWRIFLPRGLRLTVLSGALAGAVLLFIYTRIYWKKTSPQPQIVKPEVTLPQLPSVAAKKEAPKEEVPKVAKKVLPPTVPQVPVIKPKILQLVKKTKPAVETLTATILNREASFTTLSLVPQEEQIYSSLYNGNNLWLGLFTAPAKLVKVDSQGNCTIYTCAVGDDNATSLVFAQNYLWVGLDVVPLKILKVNPQDGSYVSYILGEPIPKDGTGGIRNAACFDGKYLWFGLWTKPAKLVRVNPEDLSYEIYTCKEGEDNPSFGLFDGNNVWFGLYTAPAKYIKVNPSDGTYLVYSCKEGEDYIKTGVYDGKNIWFGLETMPGKFVRVNPEDGTYLAYNLRQGENIVSAATFAQPYLWFALSTEPAKILKVNPYTGNYITYIQGKIRNISSASFDGSNIWFPDKSGKLLKVSL